MYLSASPPSLTNSHIPPTPPPSTPAQPSQPNASPAAPAPAGQHSPSHPDATGSLIQAAARPNHASLFAGILNTLAGGGMRPVRDAQGNPVLDAETGQVQMAQASKKTLAMSILSGALAGMAAGVGTSTEQQIAKASDADMDAVAKKTGTTQKNAQAGAQEEADANQLRAYTTMDHNLKIHADHIRVQQLQGDLLDKKADAGQAFDKALQLAPPVQVNGVDTDVVQVQDVGPAEVQKMLSTTNPDGTKKDPSLQVTRDSVIATGSRFVYD